jgi:serine/threonine protein kinase
MFQLEEEWRKGNRPDLASYFESVEPAQHDALALALSAVDLEFRLKIGESARVEHYLDQFPTLRENARAIRELIRVECSQRLLGAELTDWVGEYRDRFPLVSQEMGWDYIRSLRFKSQSPKPPIAKLPFELGSFSLEKELGRGSFGVVYLARNAQDTEVALKIPYGGQNALLEDVQQLLAERKYSARLAHPGIVPVLEGGIDERTRIPYIVYPLIRRHSLDKLLRLGRRFDPVDAASAMADVAEALEHAHQNKIMHRDLKPANIMTGDSGRFLVIDFGLALRDGTHSSISFNLTASSVGTPAYMAPEQVLDEVKYEATADVFSLGVVFYQILTREHPFQGSPDMILNSILHVNPAPPSTLAPVVGSDLDRICLKALSKDPNARYKTAGKMASELRASVARGKARSTR